MCRRILLCCSAILVATDVHAIDPDPDVEMLRQAKVGCDGDSLLALFKQVSADEKLLARRDEFIRQLGSTKFKEREEAVKSLIAMRSAATPALTNALKSDDAETRRNAKRCLDEIERNRNPVLTLAAVRVLLKDEPPETLDVLLRYLPASDSCDVAEQICFGLEMLAAKHIGMPAAMLRALTDESPERRAIAACIVGSHGSVAERTKVLGLLKDPHSTVRLRAAQGLLAGQEKEGIPALIALLEAAPLHEAWQAEELLHWAANGTAPDCPVREGGEWAKKSRAAWEQWWRERKQELDFMALARQPRRPCLFAIWQRDRPGFGQRVTGCDGTPRINLGLFGVRAGGRLLPDGHILAVGVPREMWERVGNPRFISEVDWTGHLYWTFKVQWDGDVVLVERLPEGRTHFVMQFYGHGYLGANGKQLIPFGQKYELAPLDKRWQWPEPPIPEKVLLHDGNRLMLDSERDRLIEFDPKDRIVGETWCLSPEGSRVQVFFRLLRLGFEAWAGRDYDLRTCLAERIRQLQGANQLDWNLAARAIRSDFRPNAREAIPALMHTLGRSSARLCGVDPEVKSAILRVSADPIRDALGLAESDDPFTRAGAICILGMYEWKDREKDARWTQFKKAFHDQSTLVRGVAAGNCPVFRDRSEEVVAQLIGLLPVDEVPIPGGGGVGAVAARSLQSFTAHALAAVPLLKNAVRSDDLAKMRAAAEVLWPIARNDPKVFDATLMWFIDILKDPSACPSLRITAARGVATWGKVPELAVAQLTAMLSSKQPAVTSVKLSVIDTLHGLGASAYPALPALLHAAIHDADPTVKEAAERALKVIQHYWLRQRLVESILKGGKFPH